MIRAFAKRIAIVFAVLSTIHPGAASAAGGLPRVRLETSAGPIVIQVDTRRAPITAGNFLAYVARKRFDGTTFYRAARSRSRPTTGLVQGGINHILKGTLAPIAHEPTTRTGLKHVDATVSMARNDPGTAMGDFFITVGPSPYLDAAGEYPGYAAFGKVVSGMDVVRKMLAGPTYPGGRSANTKGQTLRTPIKIISARRIQ